MPRVRKKKKATSRKKKNEPKLGFGARLALLMLGTITVIVLLSWVWHSRWPHTVASGLVVSSIMATKNAGFAVSDVTVEGRHYTNRKALFKALGVRANSPIFLFDPDEAHKNITALPWVESVTVLRSLPNKISIKLKERRPMARLQRNKKTIVIDARGKKLEAAKPKQFAHLPLVVGDAKPKEIRILLNLLQNHPIAADVLKAAVRVSKRRWNFHLRPKMLVKLPERDVQGALEKLTSLIQERKVLERNIKTIDLRLSNRMILEPYEDTKTR